MSSKKQEKRFSMCQIISTISKAAQLNFVILWGKSPCMVQLG